MKDLLPLMKDNSLFLDIRQSGESAFLVRVHRNGARSRRDVGNIYMEAMVVFDPESMTDADLIDEIVREALRMSHSIIRFQAEFEEMGS